MPFIIYDYTDDLTGIRYRGVSYDDTLTPAQVVIQIKTDTGRDVRGGAGSQGSTLVQVGKLD